LFFGNLTKSSINHKLNVSRGNNGGRNKGFDFTFSDIFRHLGRSIGPSYPKP